ncbi:hypothetical protein NE237_019829 [Protea cynaroides]|uniref:Uncharacterized protein n=1 Tax=Protea cynaroides TaxID=273540 RepID=A0A9Q0HA06_9MAGN|nr:hypothetical protein NE237_019829 [Protea cynaroides]
MPTLDLFHQLHVLSHSTDEGKKDMGWYYFSCLPNTGKPILTDKLSKVPRGRRVSFHLDNFNIDDHLEISLASLEGFRAPLIAGNLTPAATLTSAARKEKGKSWNWLAVEEKGKSWNWLAVEGKDVNG